MGKMLIIKGATYTAPSGGSTGGNNTPSGGNNSEGGNTGGGSNTPSGGSLNQSIVSAVDNTKSLMINGTVQDFNGSCSVSNYVAIPAMALRVEGTGNIYKSANMADYNAAICFYDEDKNFISYCNDLDSVAGSQMVGQLYAGWGSFKVDIPANAKYLRYQYMNSTTGFSDLVATGDEYCVAHLKFM